MGIKKLFKNNKFHLQTTSLIGQASVVASGTFFAQLLNMLFIPLLARLYTPEDFGVMSVYVSVITILVPFSSMRYFCAIPLPKGRRYSDACFWLCLIIEMASTLFFFVLFGFAGKKLFSISNCKELIPYRYIIPIGILAYSLYLTFTQWAIRNGLFRIIAKTKITQSVFGNLAKLSIGFLKVGSIGLITGTIISYGGGITTIIKDMLKKNMPKFEFVDIKRVSIKYRKFPQYDVWASLLDTVSWQFAPVIIVMFFGAKVSGYYSMANQLLLIPTVFVGDAIRQVFLQKASIAKYDGTLILLTKNTYKLLVELSVFPMLVLSLFSPELLSFILGKDWYITGVYAQLIISIAIVTFAYVPISSIFAIVEKQDLFFKLMGIHMVVRLVSFLITAKLTCSPLWSIGIMCATGTITMLAISYFTLLIAGVEKNSMVGIICVPIFKSILLMMPIIIVRILIPNMYVCLLVTVVMGYVYVKKLLMLYHKLTLGSAVC